MLARISNERKRQIDTLKIFNDCVVEKIPDCEYEVEFFAGSKRMAIEVILPLDFPNESPLIRVNQQIVHPWVGSNQKDITSFPGLLNFTVHSDLGRIVQAIAREFERNPPQLLEDVGLSGSPPSQNNDGHLSLTSSGTPTYSSSYGLEHLNEGEIQQILNDPDYLDKYIETLPQSINMAAAVRNLIMEIETLANENLAKQQLIDDLSNGITQRVEQLTSMKGKYDIVFNRRKALMDPNSLSSMMEKLRISSLEADEEAEEIAQEFLNGSMDVDSFVKEYEDKKCLALLRKTKLERLTHQLKQLKESGPEK